MTSRRTSRGWMAVAAVTLGLFGCVAPEDLDSEDLDGGTDTQWEDLDDDIEDTEGEDLEGLDDFELEPTEPTPLIGNAVTDPDGARGVVQLKLWVGLGEKERWATAAVIHQGVILTSAHTFNHVTLGSQGAGWAWIKVEYRPAGGPDLCVSLGTTGKCAAWRRHKVYKHPSYKKGHSAHDIAIVKGLDTCGSEHCFKGLTAYDAFGIYDDKISKDRLHRVWAYGAINGAGDTDLRTVRFKVDTETKNTIQDPASPGKMLCKGDSGAPWANYDHGGSGRYLIAGLYSGREESKGLCADNGKIMYATKPSTKIDWIETYGWVDCTPRISPDALKKWFSCW